MIFDLDGTLVDSVPELHKALNKTLEVFAKSSAQIEDVKCWIGNGSKVLVHRALSNSVVIDKSISDAQLDDAHQMFLDEYAQSDHSLDTLYPNVVTTLKALKDLGTTLAVLTNKPERFVPDILAHHKITDYFANVIGGDTFEQSKPNPVGILHLQELHHVELCDMLMVGDSENDIKAAKNAGIQSVGLTYGYNYGKPISDANPSNVFDDIAELLNIVPQ